MLALSQEYITVLICVTLLTFLWFHSVDFCILTLTFHICNFLSHLIHMQILSIPKNKEKINYFVVKDYLHLMYYNELKGSVAFTRNINVQISFNIGISPEDKEECIGYCDEFCSSSSLTLISPRINRERPSKLNYIEGLST